MCASTLACTSPQSFFSSAGWTDAFVSSRRRKPISSSVSSSVNVSGTAVTGGLFPVGFGLGQGATVSVVTSQDTG